MLRCPTDVELEGLLTGELDREESAHWSAHVESCDRCVRRAEAATDGGGLLEELRSVAREFPLESASPTRIGPYEILSVLGRGGMGIVYEARRERPDRLVALKVLRPSVASERSQRRFELEAEVLARLDHAGIARVYEVGTVEEGDERQPYFAMELVRGSPINDWAEHEGLDARARLALFLELCSAVEHAHQKGVVHRDLKPANVFVDEVGRPRVLDFGVARCLFDSPAVGGLVTLEGQVVGTLAYASPEQVAGDPASHDTRTDVYGLGALLFDLLTGQAPHRVAGLALSAAAREVAEVDPPRLRALRPELDAELEALVAKTLAREREERYPSVSALSADIRRYLADEPISARPPGPLLRLRKLIRRHRALASGLAATLLAVSGGSVLSFLQARRASAAEQVAETRAAELDVARLRAEAVWSFLGDLLTGGSLAGGRGPATTVLELLDEASLELEGAVERGDHAPEVELALRRTIGDSYSGLGITSTARKHLDRARELAVGLGSEDSSQVAEVDVLLASLQIRSRDFRGAAERARRSAAVFQREGLAMLQGDALAMLASALTQLRIDDEASAVLDRLMQLRASPEGGDPARHASALLLVGVGHLSQGLDERAEPVLREALRLGLLHGGPLNAATRQTREHLAVLLMRTERPQEAEVHLREAVSVLETSLGPSHPRLAFSLVRLGGALRMQGKEQEGLDLYRRALALVGDGSLGHGYARLEAASALGAALRTTGRIEECASAFRMAHEMSLVFHGPLSEETFRARRDLVDALNHTNALEEVLSLQRSALAAYGPGPWTDEPAARRVLGLRNNIAVCLSRLGRYADAVPQFEAVLRDKREQLEPRDTSIAVASANLAHALHYAGQALEATEYAKQAIEIWTELHGLDHPRTCRARLTLGRALSDLGQREEARRVLEATLAAQEHSYPTTSRFHYRYGEAWLALAAHHATFDDPEAMHAAIERAEDAFEASPGTDVRHLAELERLRGGPR